MSSKLRLACPLLLTATMSIGAATAHSQEPPGHVPDGTATGAVSSASAIADRFEARVDELRGSSGDIARPVLDRLEFLSTRSDALTDQTIKIQKAEAAYELAKMAREVGEIGIKEYDEGIFLQEKAAAVGKLRLSQSDGDRARHDLAELGRQLERVRKLGAQSLADRLGLFRAEIYRRERDRDLRRAELDIERAQAQIDRLEQFDAPRRRAERKANLDDALEVEREKQRLLSAEKSRLDSLKERAERLGTVADWQPILANLDTAASLDARIRETLEALRSRGEAPTATITREIETLIGELERQVRGAKMGLDALRIREIVFKLAHFPSAPGPVIAPPAQSTPSGPSVAQSAPVSRLDRVRETIIRIAGLLIERHQFLGEEEPSISAREQSVRESEASLESAQKAREACEQVAKDYDRRVAVQELQSERLAISQAESELKEAREDDALAAKALQDARTAEPKTVQDADVLRGFEAILALVKLDEEKAKLRLEFSKNQLEILGQYEQPRLRRELAAELDQTRSREFARRASLATEKAKLEESRRRKEGARTSTVGKSVRAALTEAIRQEGEIRRRLATIGASGKAPDAEANRQIELEIGRLELTVRNASRQYDDDHFKDLVSHIRDYRRLDPAGDRSGGPDPIYEKFRKLKPEVRQALLQGTDEKKSEMLRKAGFTDEEIEVIRKRREERRATKERSP